MEELIKKYEKNQSEISQNENEIKDILLLEKELRDNKKVHTEQVKKLKKENENIKKLINNQCKITGETLPENIFRHDETKESNV